MLTSLAPYLAAGSSLGEHVFQLVQIMLAFFIPSFCGGTCRGVIREYTISAAATGDYRRTPTRRGAGGVWRRHYTRRRHYTQPVTPYAVKLLREAACGCGWLVHPRVLHQAACLLLGCLRCLDTLHSVHKGEAVDNCEARDAELQASRCPAFLVSPVLSCCVVRFEESGRSSAGVRICTFVLVKQVNLGFTALLLDLATLARRILIHRSTCSCDSIRTFVLVKQVH
jgi:hypothetical protein